jgi:hypothetical protein
MASTPTNEGKLLWELSPHVCRICFARVLQRTTFDRRKVYRCSSCETEAEGPGPQVLCCCGIKVRGTRDAGVRCVPNPRRTPENPAQYVAEQVTAPGAGA